MTEWEHRCVLCAARVYRQLKAQLHREPTPEELAPRQRRLESGHCCVDCASWLATQVADIARLAADAAAWVAPGSSAGGGGHSVPSSRPPCNVDAVDPELTLTGPAPSPTVLEVVESWERMIRESRGMSPYGPASAARAGAIARSEPGGLYAGTNVTLIGVVDFLGRQVPWITTTEDFPLEDFADEIRACVRALIRWSHDRADNSAFVVECPHDNGNDTCGTRLRIAGEDVDSYFHCPRCSTEWSVDRLMLVWAETSDAAMYLDAEAVVRRYGVDRTTLDRWVRKGKITKWHGLYDVRPLALAQKRGA